MNKGWSTSKHVLHTFSVTVKFAVSILGIMKSKVFFGVNGSLADTVRADSFSGNLYGKDLTKTWRMTRDSNTI